MPKPALLHLFFYTIKRRRRARLLCHMFSAFENAGIKNATGETQAA
jgi:hypothetical protein